MIFKSLVLRDFRQFRGNQCVNFATDPQRNVTVIHGFNGSGKTTILNAFIWVLYGETTPDFEFGERLENEATFSKLETGQSMEVSVQLRFSDSNREYQLRRSKSIGKSETGQRVEKGKDVSLMYQDETGQTITSNNPNTHIEQLLPPRLYPFFFFNGERVHELASPDAYEDIEDAVKVLLDLELFDRAVSHLENGAGKRLRDDVADHAGSEGRRSRAERDRLDSSLKETEEQLFQNRRNQKALEAEKDELDVRLASMPELAKLQAERKGAEARAVGIKKELSEMRQDLSRIISDDGYLIIAPGAISEADKVLESAHKKGEIPTPLKRQFVDELLSRGHCVCERALVPGEAPHEVILAWRNKVASEQLEAAATTTKAVLGTLQKRRERAIGEIDRLQGRRAELLREQREVDERLDELSARIGKQDRGEDPVRLESRRREIESALRSSDLTGHSLAGDIEKLKAQIAEKDKEIRTLDQADADGKLAQRRLEAVENVKTALTRIRELRFDELRMDLSRRLQNVWGGIAIKDYRAQLDDHFHMSLTKDIGGRQEPVRGASTGERQVLALAFIGSLLDKARETGKEGQQLDGGRMYKGGSYGLVIDSAFGQLESEYRRDVAKWIPNLAPQVIVLVSETQWRKEVEDAVTSRVGAEWVLSVATAKRQEGKQIPLHGRAYDYVVESSDGFESTSFLEVQQ